jgi:biopolymer transport protein ExbD
MDAVTLKGDHTRMSREITDELQRLGRAGLPLVLVYPRDAAREPEVLPEVLSPDLVLDALDRADQGTSPVANLAPTAPVRPEDTARSIELLHRYAQAVASLDDLLTRYRGKWPAVVEARSRVEALRFELAQGPFSTDAPSAQPVPPLDSPSRPAPHILILSHDGSWTLNGHPLHPAHRESQLRQALARQPASTAVLQVRSDRRVSFRDLAEAMDLSTKVGFTNISVAPVLIPDRESAPE